MDGGKDAAGGLMTDVLDFTGKIVLVVGGSSGIGNGVAHAFRERGASVYVWGTRDAAAYSVEDGSDLTGLSYAKLDVTDFEAVARYPLPFETLDVLVTCQGAVAYQRKEFEMETFRKVVDVNLNSVMACCMKVEALLSASKGSAVIFGSIAGFHSSIGNPAYAASKAGTHMLVRTLGETWARHGIRINGIAPGLVDTKLTRITTEVPERLEAQIKKIPMRRVGLPADMAGPALFLASELSSYMTGQVLVIDGGRLLP
jgi:3-oxoacyl-[acyl-carrier protein] reductase